jgi:hypothetical protein
MAVRRGFAFFVVVLAAGAVAGSLLGELLGLVFPHGFLHEIFARGVSVGIPHFDLDLLALKLSLGLKLRVNLCTLFGVGAAFYFFRK